MTDRRKAPSKAETADLEPFPGLTLERIIVPESAAQFAEAADDLIRSRFVGFDTESRPTFNKGEVSQGPHVVQLATLEKAYIFQLHHKGSCDVVIQLLQSSAMIKVGFGLKSDRGEIQRKLGIVPGAVLDLDAVFQQQGYHSIGVRAAVALVFNQKFRKSKHMSTSNWGARILSPNQLLYAANDAYAALRVLHALDKPESELPITDLSPDAP